MDPAFKQCPKCQHLRTPEESGDAGVCPACGLVFAKWAGRDSFVPPSLRAKAAAADEAAPLAEITDRLLDAPRAVPAAHIHGRAAIWALLAFWGLRLALLDYRTDELLESFMHSIVIPFHEAGHVLFMPFGRFMTVLGGSLFQVLMPLIVAGAFFIQQRDAFGAGLGVWWAGASMVDVSAYIYDAADPQLPLIGGGTGADSFHDWIYLLDVFHQTRHSPFWGGLAHAIGILVMVAGLAWSAAVLWRQHRRREDVNPLLP
ncbi:MAG TPA: hypothetical protein VI279_09135 [Rhodocyclaceae bacterium]